MTQVETETEIPSLRARVAAGDRAALGEAYASYAPLARSCIRRKLRSSGWRLQSDIDDIVQEAFLRLEEIAHFAKSETSFGGCVVAAAGQAAGDWQRKNATGGRYAWSREEVGAAFFDSPDQDLSPEEFAEMEERVRHLTQLVLRMPEDFREVLLAREIDGLSAVEIAERFDFSTKKVIDLTHKARRKLEWLAARSPLADVFFWMGKRKKISRADERAKLLELLADGEWHEGKDLRRLGDAKSLLRHDPVECERLPGRYKFRYRLRTA